MTDVRGVLLGFHGRNAVTAVVFHFRIRLGVSHQQVNNITEKVALKSDNGREKEIVG